MEETVILKASTYASIVRENEYLKFKLGNEIEEKESLINRNDKLKECVIELLFDPLILKNYKIDEILNPEFFMFKDRYSKCRDLGISIEKIHDWVKKIFNNKEEK